MMFAATAEGAQCVPQGMSPDGVNAQSCSQSLLVDPSTHTVGVYVLQLPRSLERNQYAIVFADYLIKWPEDFAVPE